jgi:hypothetical protein
LLRWGERLLGLAVKIISILLIVAVGVTLGGGWTSYLNGLGLSINDHRIYFATLALVESWAFLVGVWIIPRMVAGNISAALGGGITGDDGAASMMHTAERAATSVASHASGVAAKGVGLGAKALGRYIQAKLRA